MGKETTAAINERLAREEAAPLNEEELKFAAFAKEGLSVDQQKRCDEMDLITCVRGFQSYEPRDEETRKALVDIWNWRDQINYTVFLKSGIPDVGMELITQFHEFWPEKYFGTDEYGHVLTYTKVGDINIAGLEKMNEDIMFKIIAQKLQAFTEYRKKLSKETGVQRYKYSILLDLKGCGMSLLGGRTRGMIQKVMDVAKNFFPETVWKIYCVNTPMMFRAAFGIVKPMLHPITQAKINIFNTASSLATELKSVGFTEDDLPDFLDGRCVGRCTIDVVKEAIELAKLKDGESDDVLAEVKAV